MVCCIWVKHWRLFRIRLNLHVVYFQDLLCLKFLTIFLYFSQFTDLQETNLWKLPRCAPPENLQNQGIIFLWQVSWCLVHRVIDIKSIKLRKVLQLKTQLHIYLHESPFQSAKTLCSTDCRFSKIRLQLVQVRTEKNVLCVNLVQISAC